MGVNLLLLGISKRRTAHAGLPSGEGRREILIRLSLNMLLIIDLVSALPCIRAKSRLPPCSSAAASATSAATSSPSTTSSTATWWHSCGATWWCSRILYSAIIWLYKSPWLLWVRLVVLLLLLLLRLRLLRLLRLPSTTATTNAAPCTLLRWWVLLGRLLLWITVLLLLGWILLRLLG